MLYIHLILGEKSSDPDSPAYVPTLFTFTDSPAKCQAENNLKRWEAVQRRRQLRESQLEVDVDTEGNEGPIDSIVITDTHRSLCIQTDLTMLDLHSMEHDNQKRIEELQVLRNINSGYLRKEQLESKPDLLSFYTGLGNFSILMALFEFVSKGVEHTAHHKLSMFECFLMTLMKLRLNLSHYDLGFRFGICKATVGRIFKKWIFLMNSKMGTTLIKWPSREAIRQTMPFCFRVHDGLRVTAIIDCFELYIEKPST